MKKMIAVSVYGLMIAFCLIGFKPFAKDALTYTMISQNPQKTLSKYEGVWEERRIRKAAISPKTYENGEIVGSITIPGMGYYEMPIYYGSDKINNNWQITTAGHLGNWDMFGEKGVAAVGAHNYQLFKNLNVLQPGDLFLIETADDIFVYEVLGHRIYNHITDDWTQTAYEDALEYSVNLMTCYPIDQGAEATEDTYIVYSKMVRGTQYISE